MMILSFNIFDEFRILFFLSINLLMGKHFPISLIFLSAPKNEVNEFLNESEIKVEHEPAQHLPINNNKKIAPGVVTV